MARLFVAVDLDEATRSAIAAISGGLAERLRRDRTAGRVTWVRPEHLHLTVRFLGEVERERAEVLRIALAEPLRAAGFDLCFEGVGMFPPAGRPRVVWLGVSDGRAELESLVREVEDRLEAASIPRESRRFQAHLTLGRFRSPAGRPDIDAAGARTGTIGPCRVDHVTLYESRLSSAGPEYTVLARALTKART